MKFTNPSFTFIIVLFITTASYAERILIVSPEQSHFFQTGGLAHATTGLQKALNQEGTKTDVLMPYYLSIDQSQLVDSGQVINLPVQQRAFRVFRNDSLLNPTILLNHVSNINDPAANYFDDRLAREQSYYGPGMLTGEAIGVWALAASQYILSQNYDTVILNDWSTGLVAFFLHQAKLQGKKVPKVVFAIHNIRYQGNFPKRLSQFLGIPNEYFNTLGVEFRGQLGMLKTGLNYADLIYTVSSQYAKEIMTFRFGEGLDGLLRDKRWKNKLVAVPNGIVSEEWDPSLKQTGLKYQFSVSHMSGKAQGKADLQKYFQLPELSEAPLFVLTSRLDEQKGTDYLMDAIATVAGRSNAQFIIIGDGEVSAVQRIKHLEQEFPNNIRYRIFSAALEKQAIRYGDFFVNAAWYEPSGQNQLFALKNGTIPVVSAVGGLLDSVKDGVTGLLFPIVTDNTVQGFDIDKTRDSVISALEKSLKLYKDKDKIGQMRVRGMQEDNSWSSRVRKDFKIMLEYVNPDGVQKMNFEDFKKSKSPGAGLLCQHLFERGA
jgi:starch synthase